MNEPEDRFDDRVRQAYQQQLAGEDAARERALARLRTEPAVVVPRRGWWLDPTALRTPPLVAAAALLVAIAIGAWGGARWAGARQERAAAVPAGPRSAQTVVPASTAATVVTFAFHAPGATRVCVVGDFNGWDPDATPLHRAATGEVWTVELPLQRGLHAYAFIVDGADWSVDPSAPLAPETSFGRRNALLVVDERGAL
jgi:hypothetical protein